MLHYNTNKYDFTAIDNAIHKYYPIGRSKDYYDHEGYKELRSLFVEKVHDEEIYEKNWVDFQKEIAAKTGQLVIGTTYGLDNCFSARIQVEKIVAKDMIRFREICFFVSMAGLFYSVIGIDRNEIAVPARKFYSNNFLVVSPEPGYEKLFVSLCELIEDKFTGHKLIPYFIYSQRIEGLHEDFKSDHNIQTVFNALFNRHIDLGTQVIGNKYFGDTAWVKDDYDPASDNVWIIYH